MMVKTLFKQLAVCLIIGAIMTGCARKGSYAVYTVNKPELSFEWQYPSAWQSKEFGALQLGFLGVTFIEEKQAGKDYEASFAVIAKKAGMYGIEKTLAAVARDAAVKVLRFERARILKRQALKVGGRDAEMIDAAYMGMSDIYNPAAKKVALRQIIIIVPDGDKFYTIRYLNLEDDFPRLEASFLHSVGTFRFLKAA